MTPSGCLTQNFQGGFLSGSAAIPQSTRPTLCFPLPRKSVVARDVDVVPPWVAFIRSLVIVAVTLGDSSVSVALKRTIFLGFAGFGLGCGEAALGPAERFASAARFFQSCWATGVMGALQLWRIHRSSSYIQVSQLKMLEGYSEKDSPRPFGRSG